MALDNQGGRLLDSSLAPHLVVLVTGLLVLLCILGSKISERAGIPALLVFLGIGMLAGSDGIGGIDFDNPAIANLVGTFALCVILFSGGLDTSWRNVRSVAARSILLATVGVAITAGLMGLFAWQALGFSWQEGLLLGAIVSSTDAAAVFALMRSRRVSLKGQLRPLVELESGSNDPMAYYLTLVLIGVVTGDTTSWWSFIVSFAISMPVGFLVGLVSGLAAGWVLSRVTLEYEGLRPVLSLSIVLIAYGLSEVLLGNGFLAVYVCGVVVGNKDITEKRSLLRFHDGIAWLMQIVMFLVLGLLVFPSQFPGIAVSGLLASFFLMLVARPAAVMLCMVRSKFPPAQRVIAAWTGLRGAVPIVLATFPFLAGVSSSTKLFNVVFFVVLTSVLFQGPTLMPLARRLKVDRPLDIRPRSPLEFDRTPRFHGDSLEVDISSDAAVAGLSVSELALPPGTLIVLIRQNDEFVVPAADTVIEPYDTLMLLGTRSDLHTAREILTRRRDHD